MPRDYSRGKCDECKHRGRIWKFERTNGGEILWLCGKCQQEFRHTRIVKRRPSNYTGGESWPRK